MISSSTNRRRIWLTAGVLFWLAVALSVPLIIDFSSDDIQMDSGVVAAPRNSYKVLGSLLLDGPSGAVLSGGTLALAMPKNKRITAEVAAQQLDRGEAILLLSKGELVLGVHELPAEPSTAQIAAPLVKALTAGDFKALVVRDSTVVVALPGEHRERLSRVNMRLVSADKGQVEAHGTGFWRGQRTKFSLESRPTKAAGVLAVNLKFEATLIDISYDGAYTLNGDRDLQGQAQLHLKNTDKLAQAMGTNWPISAKIGQLHVAGPLRWEATLLAFDDAQVRVDGNEARGTISLDTAGPTLISSTLAFKTLDIAAYGPIVDAKSNDPSPSIFQHWWHKFSNRLSRQSNKHINADIRLSAKTLSAGGYTFGPAAATISMKDGALSADIAEIALDVGRAAGQISIDFNRYIPKLTVRGQFEDVAVGRWTELLAGKRYLEGKGRLFAELTSQGTRLPQILGELSGRIEMAIPETGTIALSAAELDAAGTKNKEASAPDLLMKAMKGSTQVTDFSAIWHFKDGNGRLVDATAKHSSGLLRARGTYDLNRSAYDFRLLSIAGAMEAESSTAPGVTPQKTLSQIEPAPKVGTLLRISTSGKAVLPRASARPQIMLHTSKGSVADLEYLLGPFASEKPRRGF